MKIIFHPTNDGLNPIVLSVAHPFHDRVVVKHAHNNDTIMSVDDAATLIVLLNACTTRVGMNQRRMSAAKTLESDE
jgi:hypothetical protein